MHLPNLNTLFEVYKTILARVPFGRERRSILMRIGAAQFNLANNAVTGELNSFIILCECNVTARVILKILSIKCLSLLVKGKATKPLNDPQRAIFSLSYRYSNI